MIRRLSLAALLLVACSKRDSRDRATGAGATPGASADNHTADRTGGAMPDPEREGGGGSGSAGALQVKGGGGGIGLTQGRGDVSAATVRTGQPSVAGALDKDTVRRYIRRNFAALSTCYEQRLVARADLAGTLTATFVIQADGSVRDAQATGLDAEVESCFAKVIGAIQFPPPKVREDVRVSYPFMLRPTQD